MARLMRDPLCASGLPDGGGDLGACAATLEGFPVLGLVQGMAEMSRSGERFSIHVVGCWLVEVSAQVQAFPRADSAALQAARERLHAMHAALESLLHLLQAQAAEVQAQR